MSYNLIKPVIAASISIFLVSQSIAHTSDSSQKVAPASRDISDSVQKDCSEILPSNLGSYCDLEWGNKYDLTVSYEKFIANKEQYKQLFEALEELLGYPNGLLSGVGFAESRMAQSAVSGKDAFGIMQIATGYYGLLSKYESAKALIEMYVDRDSLNDFFLNDLESLNSVEFTAKPSFQDIKEFDEDTAKLLVRLYNVRDKWSRIDPDDPKIWYDTSIKKPSSEELEVIIRQVFVPLYKSIEHAKQEYFEGKLPSLKHVREDAEANIVVGALIYDNGKRELSILSQSIGENNQTHFNWLSPKVHRVNETSAINPDDLDVMAFGPYNAGFVATLWRLQIMYDVFHNKGPLTTEQALEVGAYYDQTRRAMVEIEQWSTLYDYLSDIYFEFVLKNSIEKN